MKAFCASKSGNERNRERMKAVVVGSSGMASRENRL
jgi:hypothetical protein